jgi:hypothetical protein
MTPEGDLINPIMSPKIVISLNDLSTSALNS